MLDAIALRDVHTRAHRNLRDLLAHCRQLAPDELDRELDGFGYPTVRLQLHHALGAARYWIGVLEGRIDVDDDDGDYRTAVALERLRREVFALTESYLDGAPETELNTPRPLKTWGGKVLELVPAHVVMRTVAHLYHHQGQVTAMCRLLGKPIGGLDYPHGPLA